MTEIDEKAYLAGRKEFSIERAFYNIDGALRDVLRAYLAALPPTEPSAPWKALMGAQEAFSTANEWFAQREDGKPTTNTEEAIFARTHYVLCQLDAAIELYGQKERPAGDRTDAR